MGYDCTLHIVDENAIRERFVPRLLGESSELAAFDRLEDAEKNWATVKESLEKLQVGEEDPHTVASLIGQLAIAYSAAELPYHYERGFCLSLWDSHQEDAVSATFPKKYRGNPESLFETVVSHYPKLKRRFPTEIESNFCPGIYISADKVPAALKWVERKVNSFAKPERRLFRGLILVLKEAAKQGKAYWEGTDLPVPMATMHPPEGERVQGLEEWKNPDEIHMVFLCQDGSTLVFAHGIGFPQDCRTVHIDLSEWPPRTSVVWQEYALSAQKKSPGGQWVTASMTCDQEYMYRVRLRASAQSEPLVLIAPEERKHGMAWAGFVGERVVAVLNSETQYPNAERGDYSFQQLTPAYTLIEEGGRLVPVDDLPPSSNKFPTVGAVILDDGTHVFIWDSVGYEFVNAHFEPAFKIPGTWSTYDKCPIVNHGIDAFFCVCTTISGKIDDFNYGRDEQGLFSVRRGEEPVRHLPKIRRIRGITRGPEGSVLVHELGDRSDLGKLYFPDDQTYVRIEPDVFADEDPQEIRSLHYVEQCERLIAATTSRLWARPIEHVLALPRYNAATGRLRRS